MPIEKGLLAHIEAKCNFFKWMKRKQFEDKKLSNLREKVLQGETNKAILDKERVLRI